MLSRVIRTFFGEKAVGSYHYMKGVRLKESWEGVFNRQSERRRIFEEIVTAFQPQLVVETGTFRGTTTEYMAQTATSPVITIEGNPYNAGYASRRLKPHNVQVIASDSRTGLKQVLATRPDKLQIFFYLDAHWEDDLPLRDELELIFNSVHDSVIMVDDFRVPNDPGYQFDDYGENGVLELEYIQETLNRHNASAYFPSVGSQEESGARRGCVILTKSDNAKTILNKIDSVAIAATSAR